MHAIQDLIKRTRAQTISGPTDIEDYVNSPRFQIKKAAEALFSAHFGPRDLRHTNLARAARHRQEALERLRGRGTKHQIIHVEW